MFRLELTLKPSNCLFFALFILYALALAALFCANFTLILKLLVELLLLWSGYYQCWLRTLQRSPGSIVRCIATKDRWRLIDRAGREYEAKLTGESLVTTFLIILNFGTQHPALILCPDSLNSEDLRRLRVLLLNI
ncbi:MAG: hypothetical protein PVI75_07480 [Gammaproteobacteria bacterium]|jgi:hypothetical protein